MMKRLKTIVKKKEKERNRRKREEIKKEGKKGERKGTISQPGNSNEPEDNWLLISASPQLLPLSILPILHYY